MPFVIHISLGEVGKPPPSTPPAPPPIEDVGGGEEFKSKLFGMEVI